MTGIRARQWADAMELDEGGSFSIDLSGVASIDSIGIDVLLRMADTGRLEGIHGVGGDLLWQIRSDRGGASWRRISPWMEDRNNTVPLVGEESGR